MIGKCPKCDATPNIIVEALRARDEGSQRTLPVLQFLCDQCKNILSIALDPEWQAQVVAGQLRTGRRGICDELLSIVMPSSSAAPYVEAEECLSKR